MTYRKDGGFRIYRDQEDDKRNELNNTSSLNQNDNLQIAMLHKIHSNTKIFGLLEYKDEIKGIRYYDAKRNVFIDIAPWQINFFNVSGMKVVGVRSLELVKIETGHNKTHVVEFVTQHEIKKYYRPNRMTPNDLAKALSYILDYVNDTEYENIMNNYR